LIHSAGHTEVDGIGGLNFLSTTSIATLVPFNSGYGGFLVAISHRTIPKLNTSLFSL